MMDLSIFFITATLLVVALGMVRYLPAWAYPIVFPLVLIALVIGIAKLLGDRH